MNNNECPTCKRIVMGKKKMGMCKRCYNNMFFIILLVALMVFFPIVSVVITIGLVPAINVLLSPILPAAIVLDVVYIICTIIGMIGGVVLVVLLIHKLVSMNKSL